MAAFWPVEIAAFVFLRKRKHAILRVVGSVPETLLARNSKLNMLWRGEKRGGNAWLAGCEKKETAGSL